MFSSVIKLVVRVSDTDSENVSLIKRSISCCQKIFSSTGYVIDRYVINSSYKVI